MAWSDAARAAALEARRRKASAQSKDVHKRAQSVLKDFSRLQRLTVPRLDLSSSRDLVRWQKQSNQLFHTVARSHGFKVTHKQIAKAMRRKI